MPDVIANYRPPAPHPRKMLSAFDRNPLNMLSAGFFRRDAFTAELNYRIEPGEPYFQDLRERLEARHGPLAGRRHYVRVLQLLAEHPRPRVQQALEHSQGFDGLDAEVIAVYSVTPFVYSIPASVAARARITGSSGTRAPRGRRRAASARRSGPRRDP